MQRRFVLLFLFFWTVSALYGEYRTITHADQKEIAAWIDDKDYRVATGPITQLVMKQKFWKSDPQPTFAVGDESFEYGLYSNNRGLENHTEGGPLAENRQVSVWHRDGRILRLYLEE